MTESEKKDFCEWPTRYSEEDLKKIIMSKLQVNTMKLGEMYKQWRGNKSCYDSEPVFNADELLDFAEFCLKHEANWEKNAENTKSMNTQYQRSFIESLVKKHDNRIIDVLKENGYTFDNPKELEEFAKERCKLVKEDNKRCTLFVDGNAIVVWWDTVRLKQNGNTFTAIMGEEPEK